MNDNSSCVRFLQRLIQTESLPAEEGQIAQLVKSEMVRLGFDEVSLDEAGNVIGLVRGRGEAPPLMFNTHLDHVAVGDHARWPYPPFGGEVHGGRVWGRGAVDIKGPLAAQVHGVAQLIAEGIQPPGDVYVTGVVQEEVGGLGARHMATHLVTPVVIIGEPSGNEVRRGHRGRSEYILHAVGKSVHASVPQRGVNPLEVVSGFILRLKELKMTENADLGPSSVAPTLLKTDQTSANVVPAEVWLTCDWRSVPEEQETDILQKLQHIADASLIPGARAKVESPVFQRMSYTGLTMEIPAANPAYLLPASHPAVEACWRILHKSIGLTAPVNVWDFATDGGHFAVGGMSVVGFGPGDESLAHTVKESIEISALETAVAGNRALALELSTELEHRGLR